MDAQENPLPENQAQPNQSQAEVKNEGTEAPPQMTIQQAMDHFNQRISICENLLTELMKAFQMSGQAINRLETFTFAQVKVMLQEEQISFGNFIELQKDLQNHDDLHDYWGVPKPEVPTDPTSVESASTEG